MRASPRGRGGAGCCVIRATSLTALPPSLLASHLARPAAAFFTQTVQVDEDVVKFEIWDTAGQERYHSLAPMYYRGAKAAVIVYDITKSVRALTLRHDWRAAMTRCVCWRPPPRPLLLLRSRFLRSAPLLSLRPPPFAGVFRKGTEVGGRAEALRRREDGACIGR